LYCSIFKNSSNTNYDQDDREFLGDLLDFSKVQSTPNSPYDEEHELCEDFDNFETFLEKTEQNCLYNIAGTYNDILFLKLKNAYYSNWSNF